MSDNRRILELYLNVDASRAENSLGDNLTNYNRVPFQRGSRDIVWCHLRLNDHETYFTPPAGATWMFRIKDSFTQSDPTLVRSDDEDFNVSGDWSDLDVENGKISFRVNTSTTGITTAMGDSAFLEMYAELWMTPAGGNPTRLCLFDVLMHNMLGSLDTDTDLVFTSSSAVGFDGDDVVIYYPDGSEANRWEKP